MLQCGVSDQPMKTEGGDGIKPCFHFTAPCYFPYNCLKYFVIYVVFVYSFVLSRSLPLGIISKLTHAYLHKPLMKFKVAIGNSHAHYAFHSWSHV